MIITSEYGKMEGSTSLSVGRFFFPALKVGLPWPRKRDSLMFWKNTIKYQHEENTYVIATPGTHNPLLKVFSTF